MRHATFLLILLAMGCKPDEDTGPAGTTDDTGEKPDTGDSGGDDTAPPPPDEDGDGYDADHDCDDNDPDINPGAEEIPYDGIDQDCSGYDLTDVDEDGYDAEDAGGDDCDDDDASIHPDAYDGEDGIDDDCDGKIDEDAQVYKEEWPVIISGTSDAAGCWATRVDVTEDGYVVALGGYMDEVDFDTHPNGETEYRSRDEDDSFIIKLNEDHEEDWIAGVSADDVMEGHQLRLGPDGEVAVAGVYAGTTDFDIDEPSYETESAGESDGFVGLWDPEGNLTWGASFGGETEDESFDALPTGFGTVYVTGYFTAETDFDPGRGDNQDSRTPAGAQDAYVTQLTAGGKDGAAYGFTVTFGGSSEDDYVTGKALAYDETWLYLVGTFVGTVDLDPGESEDLYTAEDDARVFVVALDPADGSLQWSAALDSTGDIDVNDMRLTTDGALLIGGWFAGDIDLDPGDGSQTYAASGDSDGFWVVLSTTGTFADGGVVSSTGADTVIAVDTDPSGQVVLAGGFEDSIVFGSTAIESLGGVDAYALALDGTGGVDWAIDFGNEYDQSAEGVAVDPSGVVYFAGALEGTIDFGLTETDNRSALSSIDAWVYRME